MTPDARFDIIETIAQGDFATVYRALDKELGREVAIKQIHQQYLVDPKKLERYWHEAHLLAKLEHPYIMTIYDIVRERGWLILELMQGSLKDKLAGRPMDLDDLRRTIIYMCHALSFLQNNGIIHGDVKPSNLLLNKNHRVKLGDFGIARRIAGDEGSVVKGTTKYMAPEVVSDQFGSVGPHSDLYSLGFSAFELMCGDHFDTLFPGLNMFGRDQQIAWMMWHSAPDRRLPEIHRVLQGVPGDLAHVIEKLTEKDPAKRYHEAEEVIEDLRHSGRAGEDRETAKELAGVEQEVKKSRVKQFAIFGALAFSLCLSVAILLIPGPKERDQGPAVTNNQPQSGVVNLVDLERKIIELRTPHGKAGIQIDPDLVTIRLNGRPIEFDDLKKEDELQITYKPLQNGQTLKIIDATRTQSTTVNTSLASIDRANAVIELATGGESGGPLKLQVSATANITLNGNAATLGDLTANDAVMVQHRPSERGQLATTIAATRVVSAEGVIIAIDSDKRELVFRSGAEPNAPQETLPLSDDCAISLNDVTVLPGGKIVGLSDLTAGDRIELEHHSQITRLDAKRELSASGVVQSVDTKERRLVAALAQPSIIVDFALAPSCKITLADSDAPCDLSFIRPADEVTITHASADLKDPQARAIEVKPARDPSAWAIVIGQENYDDNRLPRILYSADDAQLLRDTLRTWYRIPDEQLLFETNASRLRLEQVLPSFLQKVPAEAQLIVYFSGHGYFDKAGIAQLAPKEFDSGRMDQTGVRLSWLIKQLDESKAAAKLLLLDKCRASVGGSSLRPPASSELVESLRGSGQQGASSSVTILASCATGQRGVNLKDEQHGAFATYAAEAFRGAADVNSNHRVDRDELDDYLTRKLVELSSTGTGPQTPVRFLPDASPARVSPEYQQAALKLLGYLGVSSLSD